MNKFCSALLVGNLMSQTLVCSVYFILIVLDLQMLSLKEESLVVKCD